MRERILRGLSQAVINHRRLVIVLAVLSFGAALAWVATGHLGMHSSRHAIVNPDDPEQVRLQQFADRFGATNDLIVVLESEQPKALQTTADMLAEKFGAIDGVTDIFYRIDLDAMANVALYYLPTDQLRTLQSDLNTVARLLPKDSAEKTVHFDGLIGALSRLTQSIEAFSDGHTGGLGQKRPKPNEIRRLADTLTAAVEEVQKWLTDETHTRFSFEERAASRDGRLTLDKDGYLTAHNGTLLIMRLGSSADLQDDKYARPLVTAIRNALSKWSPSEVTYGVTGVPAMVVDEQDAMQRDLPLTGAISAVGCLLIFFLAYRSLSSTLLIIVPLALGLMWALGLTALTVGHLNLLTNTMVVILIGMGIDFSVHLMTRIRHEQARGANGIEATHRAMALTGPAIFTGAVTSAVAFATMVATNFSALEELGIIASLGLMSVLFATFLMLPLMLGRSSKHTETPDEQIQKPPHFARSHAGIVVGVGLVITVALASQIKPVQFNLDLDVLLPADSPSLTTLQALEKRGLGALEFAVMQSDSMARIQELTKAVEALQKSTGDIDRVESILDVLPEGLGSKEGIISRIKKLAGQLPKLKRKDIPPPSATQFRAKLATLEEQLGFDIPVTLRELGQKEMETHLNGVTTAVKKLSQAIKPVKDKDLARRIQRFDKRASHLMGHMDSVLNDPYRPLSPADLPTKLTAPFYRQIDGKDVFAVRIYPSGKPSDPDFSVRFRNQLREIDPNTTGYAITYAYFGLLMQDGFKEAALWAAIVVIFLVLLDFRSPKYALLALVPLAIGATWMVGLMNVLGIGYTFANVVSIPLIIGIGIDSGIHLVHRWRELNGDVEGALWSTGRAILVSSLTTMMAFGSLLLSSHGGTSGLGLTLLIGVTTCAIASLVFLPAVLALLPRQS